MCVRLHFLFLVHKSRRIISCKRQPANARHKRLRLDPGSIAPPLSST
ncbi:hypothetical protein C7S16_5412 [Burkholderia thailandensis]|uniref:Uncharacterized protein n=1 Tax=Burkholderia thailandensis TaxID=57975 RepID=A0AAW9D0L9_BURTH|nr:hypothetical protein [Burkholderia thailandensis]MDW9253554.1 hypothetical protein [Burkholderia thailandensis]